jgi:BirA family transcriptional regulator, biotin operon repressor / biotin---[acetyl-CoA-carboxylase] ligase
MEDTLAAEVVQPLLEGRFGDPYLYEPETESTQSLLLDSSLPDGAVAATEHQTAGRGRRGRSWEEPPGTSVLCSVLLHPPATRNPPELSLVAALAAAQAVEETIDLSVQVKWPNDVMLDRWKISGILAEMRGEEVVVGIGINVNQTRGQLAPPAGSLRTVTGREHDRAALLALMLSRLERAYDAWQAEGLVPLRGEIGARDFLRGRRVTVDGEAGTAVGINALGQLEVDFDGGRRLIGSGEVLLAHDLG